jgi:5'-deoxynucleotidase YfbR-like HD superfamily hydrolase
MSPSTCKPSTALRNGAALAGLVHDLPELATTDPQVSSP